MADDGFCILPINCQLILLIAFDQMIGIWITILGELQLKGINLSGREDTIKLSKP